MLQAPEGAEVINSGMKSEGASWRKWWWLSSPEDGLLGGDAWGEQERVEPAPRAAAWGFPGHRWERQAAGSSSSGLLPSA